MALSRPRGHSPPRRPRRRGAVTHPAGPLRRAPRPGDRPPALTRRRHGRYLEPMITAIVFGKAARARIPEVAEAIAALEGVSEVYSVTGQIDLISLVRVSNHDDVARV